MTVAVDSIDALGAAVVEHERVLPRAGATKPALSTPADGAVTLDLSALRGIVDYDPGELTLTAYAATTVAEIDAALAEHGQQLPFDPPLRGAGATLGGVVAAGTGGSGAFRYGGVRDAILGVRFVDGTGTLVTAGGRVVKNAAGFDFPKLLVGSMGRLGVLGQITTKVLPRAVATTTVAFHLPDTAAALEAVSLLARGPVELDALDLEPGGRVLVRLAGEPALLEARARRLDAALDAPGETLAADVAAEAWRAASEMTWVPAGARLVRAATTVRGVPALEEALIAAGAARRYANAANVAWIAWPAEQPLDRLDEVLARLGIAGMVLTGSPGRCLLGARRGGAFAARLRAALDPDGRFPED